VSLRIGILSRLPRGYSTERLREACLRAGHRVRVLDTLRVSVLIGPRRPKLFYRGEKLGHYDAVVPRIGASVSAYGSAVVEQFEHAGVFTPSPAQAIRVSRDKLRALSLLAHQGIRVPETVCVRDRASIRRAVRQVGGPPAVVKLLEGTQGTGVILADTYRLAESVLDALLVTQKDVLVQRFVRESRGRDIRAFVVGGRVVAAMQRRAAPDDFRTNVHRGGRIERRTLEPSLARIAARAAEVLGLGIAGVDLIESDDGPLVLEVNSSPGLEGIERATGIDVAAAVVEYLEANVAHRLAEPAPESL